jgi:hypothetical protein
MRGDSPDCEQLVPEVEHCLEDLLGIVNAPLYDPPLERGYLVGES